MWWLPKTCLLAPKCRVMQLIPYRRCRRRDPSSSTSALPRSTPWCAKSRRSSQRRRHRPRPPRRSRSSQRALPPWSSGFFSSQEESMARLIDLPSLLAAEERFCASGSTDGGGRSSHQWLDPSPSHPPQATAYCKLDLLGSGGARFLVIVVLWFGVISGGTWAWQEIQWGILEQMLGFKNWGARGLLFASTEEPQRERNGAGGATKKERREKGG